MGEFLTAIKIISYVAFFAYNEASPVAASIPAAAAKGVTIEITLASATVAADQTMWQRFGHKKFMLTSKWPVADPSFMQRNSVTIVVQVNGKLRGPIEVPNPPAEVIVMAAVRPDETIQNWVAGKQVVQTISLRCQ